ncbi:MAG: hypothetical protein ACE5FY_07265, partial [Nitrospiria bacterium]
MKKDETIVVRNKLKFFLFQMDKAGTTAFCYHRRSGISVTTADWPTEEIFLVESRDKRDQA